ncbi:aspartyl-phosphate phosphatase Spo0E family protein [Ornithinibacillus scapharcae]|uniref:aspartyl-phosphate phosphatase Spo0E family protein n=1 Tax=Ornithinibacillus scapharcae TaxID=1147159 RepID=UPI000225BB87|nr:aspartyl-phosphate phosphatase Spo0E family protein [Ornithinibacillus scapharcae]
MKENKRMKKLSLEEIEKKRIEMLEEAKYHGISSPIVLKKSEELDKLIIDFMKK